MTVYVGAERKRWAVHEKLLTSQSDYFKRAISSMDRRKIFKGKKGSAEPGESGGSDDPDSLDLPDDDPKLFALTVRWLYGMTFAGRYEFAPVVAAVAGAEDVTVRDYMALYVLGTKLGIEGLKNAAINVVYDHYHAGLSSPSSGVERRRCPDLRDVRYVFENTAEDAQLRRLLIVSTLFYLFSSKDLPGNLPPEWEGVLRSNGDIGWELIKMVNGWRWVMGASCPSMTIKKRCSFHEHTDGGQRCDD